MPLMKCSSEGKPGWKYGDKGKCYTGPGAKKKAIKQGVAIDGPDGFKTNAEVSKDELEVAIAEMIQFGVSGDVIEDAAAYLTKQERDVVPQEDFGDPADHKYPIRDQHDLDSAAHLIGRAPPAKQAAIKKRIIAIAKRKNLKLPSSW